MGAHDAAGLGGVAELIGELQQRELAFDTLRQSSHSIYPEDPGGCSPARARVGEQPRLWKITERLPPVSRLR